MRKTIVVLCIGLLLCSTMLAGHIDPGHTTIPHREASGSPSSNNSVYDLLVIAPDDWKDDVEPLRQHKESQGVSTVVVGLDEIYGSDYFSARGRDEAERVKYFIKNALDEWNITYVLLVGGRQPGVDEQWYCPVRYISEELWEGPYLGDLYFADIYNEDDVFQSWDTNEDDLFGTQNDDMDLYPDVYLGRWACRSRRELRTVVAKTIAYETQATHSNKIVLVGGDIFDDEEQYLEGEMIPEQTMAYLPEYEAVRVYASQTTVSAKNIKNALENGAAFMHMDGHCWMTYLSVYKPGQFDQFEPGIGIWHLPFFSNTEYPIAVIGGCRTAQFNVAVFNKPEQTVEPPMMAKYFPALYSLSWGFVRTRNGGSVATIGYTIPPFFGMGEHGDEDNDGIEEPDILEIGMGMLEPMVFYAHGMEGKQHLGDCWGYSLNKYIDTFGDIEDVWQPWNTATIHGFVLLGDPSLKIGGYPLGTSTR